MSDGGGWDGRRPNPQFPACAQVARKLLAEVYGCRPGDQIPPEAELLARAEQVAAGDRPLTGAAARGGLDVYEAAKARTALSMVREIGGL